MNVKIVVNLIVPTSLNFMLTKLVRAKMKFIEVLLFAAFGQTGTRRWSGGQHRHAYGRGTRAAQDSITNSSTKNNNISSTKDFVNFIANYNGEYHINSGVHD